ncbi:MAG: endonuclease/exonuclease/phosphatase family protein [Halobacteriovoraceae bacterium]|nr:endonuclease/exonuclease/phosphatase family protein [Halobacteriovoraceae bacterium]MCB9093920.1 endonuclease/exonuclease/phosphatase family protein [Halobacteriovoraceae bacterium]
MATYSLLSYNIHKGFNIFNIKQTLDKFKNQLNHMNPDLILLQEVIGSHTKKRKQIKETETSNQYQFLAEEFWPYNIYGKNAVYTEGHHGNAILSRFPIVHEINHNISVSKLEKRSILYSKVKIKDYSTNIHVMCTHLNLLKHDRRKQVDMIVEFVETLKISGEPFIICGDFNDWTLDAHRNLKEKLNVREAHQGLYGKLPTTFPSFMPVLKLDRVYYKNLNVFDVRVLKQPLWKHFSDHLALFCQFELV